MTDSGTGKLFYRKRDKRNSGFRAGVPFVPETMVFEIQADELGRFMLKMPIFPVKSRVLAFLR